MNLFKSSNPALSDKIFKKAETIFDANSPTMSVKGTMTKFGFLFLMVMGSAIFTWNLFQAGQSVTTIMITGAIGGLVLGLIMAFKPNLSRYIAPAYALAEGFFLGGLSAMINYYFEEKYPNIILQAVGLTFGVVVAMFFLYSFRIIKVTEQLKSVIVGATVGIAVFYLIAFVLRYFGVYIPVFMMDTGTGSTFGIIFSLVVVGVAALNLLLDFDRMEKLSTQSAPKYMEWYCAFALLLTIVWLYIEILKLLTRLSGRKD